MHPWGGGVRGLRPTSHGETWCASRPGAQLDPLTTECAPQACVGGGGGGATQVDPKPLFPAVFGESRVHPKRGLIPLIPDENGTIFRDEARHARSRGLATRPLRKAASWGRGRARATDTTPGAQQVPVQGRGPRVVGRIPNSLWGPPRFRCPDRAHSAVWAGARVARHPSRGRSARALRAPAKQFIPLPLCPTKNGRDPTRRTPAPHPKKETEA